MQTQLCPPSAPAWLAFEKLLEVLGGGLETEAQNQLTGHSLAPAPGGLLGWMTDQLAAPIVRRHIHHTLQNLKRQIESSQAEKARRAPRKRTPARA